MGFLFADTQNKLKQLYNWGYSMDVIDIDNELIYVIGHPSSILCCVSDLSMRKDIGSIVSAAPSLGRFFLIMVKILEEDGEEYDYESPESNTSFMDNNGVIGCMTLFDVVDYAYKYAKKEME